MTSTSSVRRELRAISSVCLSLVLLGSTFVTNSLAQQTPAIPMRITLDQAIELALKQNRSVLLRSLSVEKMQSKKDDARSKYLPKMTASGSMLHITELEGVVIPAGAFGTYPSTGAVPSKALSIDQGSATWYLGGVGLEQPLTQQLRNHEANVEAKQDVLVARTQLDQTQDEIALQIRQLYYNVLINEQKFNAAQDELAAAQVKDEESQRNVARGNALEVSALQSKTSVLRAQEETLTLRLQGNDLRRQLADALGLPVKTQLELDPGASAIVVDIPSRADAIRIALDQNQDLKIARQSLVKAQAGLAAAKDAYIPDVTALSRYSYQNGVPFLARNFGTFGFSLSYDLFDGGSREAKVREAQSEVRSAYINVDKLKSEIEVQVQSIYDRIDEFGQIVDVAEQSVQVGTEAARLADRQFEQAAALSSTRTQSHADLTSATAFLFEAKCSLTMAKADLKRELGQMPR
jgi:outer membrane protein TolC